MRPKVDVILPCLNEAEALAWVLGRMPLDVRPIVVDNSSTDGSAKIARDHGAYVVPELQQGYGAACHAGLLAATAPVVVVMDADASLDPQQLNRVVAPLVDGTADLVIGRRSPVNSAAFAWPLRLANRELSRQLFRRTGLRLTDLGPMRAAGREALLALHIKDRRSGYPAETVVRAADAGWRTRCRSAGGCRTRSETVSWACLLPGVCGDHTPAPVPAQRSALRRGLCGHVDR